MLHANPMTDNRRSLFYVVDGEVQSNAFSVKATPTDTIDDLKVYIHARLAIDTLAIDTLSKNLTLWRVSIPVVPSNKNKPIVLSEIESAIELHPTDDLSDVFEEKPPKKTIHIIVQRPPQVHTPIPARASTPLPGYLSDNSRPGTPLSGDLRTDIKKITDTFFAPGPIANFLRARL